RKRAYCLKIQPATGSFARNLIYSTKPRLWITAKGFVFSYTYSALTNKGTPMKIILWAVLIIFLIGLLVVTGVFKMIF
ncbi:small membrane protein YohP, partial [Escherichia coli]|uniref:small membrane protein YohP n=1 Tax=Escherichia coli TaxID=562 RepID=UPI001FCEE606